MFYEKRNKILSVVTLLRRMNCCYDMLMQKGREPVTCDCKYGMKEPQENSIQGVFHRGEQTGCPELRCVEALLKYMTDKEYELIMNRADGILLESLPDLLEEKLNSKCTDSKRTTTS